MSTRTASWLAWLLWALPGRRRRVALAGLPIAATAAALLPLALDQQDSGGKSAHGTAEYNFFLAFHSRTSSMSKALRLRCRLSGSRLRILRLFRIGLLRLRSFLHRRRLRSGNRFLLCGRGIAGFQRSLHLLARLDGHFGITGVLGVRHSQIHHIDVLQ